MNKTALALFISALIAQPLFAELDKEKLFGRRVYNQKKSSVKTEELDAKVYGIYFSAHWCPPCRQFTPLLVDAYNKINETGGSFKIIFVSWDHTEAEQFEYMKEMNMPWYVVKFHCAEAEKLKNKYSVDSIPRLVIIDSEGTLITKDARADVMKLGSEVYEKWIQ